MTRKYILLLKDFFFKFNSAFLSGVLEDRMKHSRVFSQLLFFLRKQLFFYSVCLIGFCFFLAKAPFILQNFWNKLLAEQQVFEILLKVSFCSIVFIGLFYLTQFLRANTLRTADFFIARVQLATRYLTKQSEKLEFTKAKTSHLLQFVFSALAIIPLSFLYYSLFSVLHMWTLIPIFTTLTIFCLVGIIKNKNAILLSKSDKSYQNDISFFSTIEKYLPRIRTLGFNSILQKKILSFSGNSVLFYQKIFENEIVITGIKYCGVFILFSLNAGLFILNAQKNDFSNFLPVLALSFFIGYYQIALLRVFDYYSGAKSVFHFLKTLDRLLDYDSEKQIEFQEDDAEFIISFKDASFVKDNQVVFHQLSHQIKAHKLVAVIGSTYEERSNYLNACIGSLKRVGGKHNTPDKFEFLSKKTIILEGNIRENIVQFHDFDPRYYNEVLKACALSKELELLQDADLTKLDPNDKKFSPDFLRKIAIARIVYAKNNVNFFDEPFLDLSLSDATQIFYEAFQKLLGGTTRVFCTDKTEFAALSDEILICKAGRIIEQGTHVTLLTYDSLYSRLFYAGAESKRYEIVQSHSKYSS